MHSKKKKISKDLLQSVLSPVFCQSLRFVPTYADWVLPVQRREVYSACERSLIFAAWVVKLEIKQWLAALKCLCYRPLNGLTHGGPHTSFFCFFLFFARHSHAQTATMLVDGQQAGSLCYSFHGNKRDTDILSHLLFWERSPIFNMTREVLSQPLCERTLLNTREAVIHHNAAI